MCRYCENDGYYKANKSLISKTLKNNVNIDLSINVKDKKIVASVENLAMSVEDNNWFLPTKKINYCPMCRTKIGRKGSEIMTKEQEVIKYIKTRIKICNENADICDDNDFDEEATYLREESYMLETALNMLKEKDEKIEKYKNMIIEHKKQLRQSGIYGYDYDLKID